VAAGSRQLHVELSYDPAAGVLDLGCFGPAGEFRGYSGSARGTFTVGEDGSTPGYLAGPLAPGTWQVLLGLHRVAPDGLPWTVTAWTSRSVTGTPPPVTGLTVPVRGGRSAPAGPGLTWLAADLHAHTVHSDGTLTVAELAGLAAQAGLDVLAVTDHNTVSHHAELLVDGMVLLPGQEITTDRGHANALGDIGWVDFRQPADVWVSTVDARGGLLSVNHPLGGDCAWLHPLRRRPPLAEVWHSGWWDRTWGAPLAWLLAWGADTVPVGGSDFHRLDQPSRPGHPTTWIACAERSVAGVLDGLRAGRTAISAAPDGPLLLSPDGDLVALDADGTLLVDLTGRRRPVRGRRAAFTREVTGPHWLEDHRAQVLAISA
jgi:hypothetical protein